MEGWVPDSIKYVPARGLVQTRGELVAAPAAISVENDRTRLPCTGGVPVVVGSTIGHVTCPCACEWSQFVARSEVAEVPSAAPNWPTMASDVGTARVFVRLIWRSWPAGTVITTGDHPAALGFSFTQVPPVAAVQLYPHIDTAEPSGRAAVDSPAVRLICAWPNAETAPNSNRLATITAALSIDFIVLVRIASSPSIGFIDHKFPGIDQHHHHHSARKNIVGGDFALIVGVPHKRKAGFTSRWIRDGARRRSRAGGSAAWRVDCTWIWIARIASSKGRPARRIRPQIGASTKPGTIGQDVRIRQGDRAASSHVTRRCSFQWLVVVLAPFEVVDRVWCTCVVAIRVRSARHFRVRISRLGIVSVGVPIQASARPVEDAIHRLAWRGRGSEQQRTRKAVGIGLAHNQISVPRQHAYVIAVFVEGMLPSALSNYAQQHEFAWMHVGIA